MNELDRVLDYIRKLSADGFFGHFHITMEAGKAKHLKVEQSFMPHQIPETKPEARRTYEATIKRS